tara:strand:+ start:189 stop:428 length:240 start_codon:yes stop_codon:yes gene_type:complete
MDNVTKHMTPSEIRGFAARLMVRIDDLKRQRELVSRLSRTVADGEESDDLMEVLGMLNNLINEKSESVRELKAILASKR